MDQFSEKIVGGGGLVTHLLSFAFFLQEFFPRTIFSFLSLSPFSWFAQKATHTLAHSVQSGSQSLATTSRSQNTNIIKTNFNIFYSAHITHRNTNNKPLKNPPKLKIHPALFTQVTQKHKTQIEVKAQL